MSGGAAVQVDGLSKAYSSVTAVDNVSFTVRDGEIFGLLGPNGAGKTTVIECLETLRRPDRGVVRILGFDPQRDAYEIRTRIGVQLQSGALQERIKLWEALDLFASFYRNAVDWQPLLVQLGLAESANVPFGNLSGGQKQRAFIALALINDPQVVFLDELTTSLDPQARHAIWDLIRAVRDRGTTVFLTTHFMEEAERLCDRVAIMSHGRIVALDSPANLIRSAGVDNRVILSARETFDVEPLTHIPGVTRVERRGEHVVIYGHNEELVSDVIGILTSLGVRCRDVRTEQPTLEDVFLSLTGDSLIDAERHQ